MKCYVCGLTTGSMEEAVNARGSWAHKSVGECATALQQRVAVLEKALTSLWESPRVKIIYYPPPFDGPCGCTSPRPLEHQYPHKNMRNEIDAALDGGEEKTE